MRSLLKQHANRAYDIVKTASRAEFVTYYGSVRRYSSAGDEKIIKSPYKDVPIPRATVGEFMWRELHLWPDRTALVCGESGRPVKYHELQKMSRTFAASLRSKLRVREGDCLAIMMPNLPEFPVATLGALEAGCVVSTINIMYTKEEIKRQLTMSGAQIVVTSNSIYAIVKKAIEDIKRDIKVIIVNENNTQPAEGTINFDELSLDPNVEMDCLKDVKISPEDIAFLPYSSGTTGMPKGVELTHQNVVSSICQQTLTNGQLLTVKCTKDFQDSLLCIVPFFHISGLMVQMMSKLNIGNKLITMPRFRPDDFVRLQLEHRTTAMLAAPPLAIFLANYPEVTEELMAPFRNILFGAAPSATADLVRIHEKNPKLTIAQGYGLTESSGVGIANVEGSHNFASCGYMIANSELKIVDAKDNRTPLDVNKVGELWIRGPHIMKGYKDNAEATAEAFAEGGWFRTGDLGYYDQNFEFYIVDRLKDLIKVKGYQVAPAELEGVLRSHPKIGDAAVVGVPHAQHGETPKAFVVVDDDDVTEEEIKKFVAERVAPYKHISLVEYVDEIPKSPAGKILRKELKVASA